MTEDEYMAAIGVELHKIQALERAHAERIARDQVPDDAEHRAELEARKAPMVARVAELREEMHRAHLAEIRLR